MRTAEWTKALKGEENMNTQRFTALSKAYVEALTKAVKEHPEEYTPNVPADKVGQKMLAAISTKGIGGVNIDGRGFRGAAKILGIKNTYKAWNVYLTEECP
jgi:hypothetical protein